VKRFLLSAAADRDLDEILDYLDALPDQPAATIASAIQKTIRSIAMHPLRGSIQSELTRLAGVEVRSRLVHPYRFLCTVGGLVPQIIAVLHTARDIAAIMARRLQ